MHLRPPLLYPTTIRITTEVKKRQTTTLKGFIRDGNYPALLRNTLPSLFLMQTHWFVTTKHPIVHLERNICKL